MGGRRDWQLFALQGSRRVNSLHAMIDETWKSQRVSQASGQIINYIHGSWFDYTYNLFNNLFSVVNTPLLISVNLAA